MIKLLLADDHQPVREAWKLILSRDERFQVIAECESGESAVDLCRKLQPDIVLMDISMRLINGVEATRHIRTFSSRIKIIGVSVHTDYLHVNSIMQAGANGYVTKSASVDEMTDAIIKITNGETYICKDVEMLIK